MDTRLRVLFIDRDPSVTGAAADAIAAKMGLDVVSAVGFDLAEDLLHEASFDVLVADIRVPGTGTGKEFIARFTQSNPRAGLVLVSANPVLYTQFYPAHAICLQKPYDTDQLAQAIMEAGDRATQVTDRSTI